MSTLEPSGPAYDDAFNPFGPSVTLTATATVDGETVMVQRYLDRAAWQCIERDPALRTVHERTLRQDLAAALVDRLTPTITVYDPAASLGDAVSNASARADTGVRYEPEPEHCQSLELSSEA
jgi:hypothetical protein